MRNHVQKISLMLALFCWVLLVPLQAQDKKQQLEEKKKKLEQDIRYTTKLLSETEESKRSTLSQLSLINSRIRSRAQLITTISSEVEYLREQIKSNEREIKELNTELEELKEEYARLVYHAYKTKSKYHKMMFVFSAENFNQAYRRLKYLRQYGDYRKKQAELIKEKKNRLNEKIAQLKQDTERKVDLLANKEQERQKLKSEKEGQSKVVQSLKSRESQLKRELRRKQAQAQELEREIERIIAAEMAKNRSETPESPSAEPEFSLTPEQVALSDDFTGNKGKLPWPTKRGEISSTFGTHAHKTLVGIVETNNGITIATSKNSNAHAVFKGQVTKVITISNKKAVLVQHGQYFTLYDNLATVNVKPGQEISTGDVIGKIRTDSSSGTTEINFQIWRASTKGSSHKLNPQGWLLPR